MRKPSSGEAPDATRKARGMNEKLGDSVKAPAESTALKAPGYATGPSRLLQLIGTLHGLPIPS